MDLLDQLPLTHNALMCKLEKGAPCRPTPLCCDNFLTQVALFMRNPMVPGLSWSNAVCQRPFLLDKLKKILIMLHDDFSLGMDKR